MIQIRLFALIKSDGIRYPHSSVSEIITGNMVGFGLIIHNQN